MGKRHAVRWSLKLVSDDFLKSILELHTVLEDHLLTFSLEGCSSVGFEIEVLFPLSSRFDVELLEKVVIFSIGAFLEKMLQHVVLGVHLHRLSQGCDSLPPLQQGHFFSNVVCQFGSGSHTDHFNVFHGHVFNLVGVGEREHSRRQCHIVS